MPPLLYLLTLRVDVVLRGTGLSGAELSDYLRWQREMRAAAILRGTLLRLLPELLLLLLTELLLLLLKLGPSCRAAFIGRDRRGWGRW